MVGLNCRIKEWQRKRQHQAPNIIINAFSSRKKNIQLKITKIIFFLMDDKRTHIVIAQHTFIKALIYRQMLTIIHTVREWNLFENCFNWIELCMTYVMCIWQWKSSPIYGNEEIKWKHLMYWPKHPSRDSFVAAGGLLCFSLFYF